MTFSLAMVDEKTSKEINKKYRKKNKPTNVLSFSLSTKSGELILCPNVIMKETKKFGKSYNDLLKFLIIHGMLHLAGHDHGEEMERLEEKFLKKV